MTTNELLKIQSEIKALSDDFNAYYADWQGAKVRLLMKMLAPGLMTPF